MASEEGQVAGNIVLASDSDTTETIANLAISSVDTTTDDESEDGEGLEEQEPDIFACDFSDRSWREDLTLRVEGKQIFVSSSVLAYASPVLSAMFDEHFTGDGPKEIELLNKSSSDVIEFLRCIYPKINKSINIENVFVVLPLAGEYRVEDLKEKCEAFLNETLSAQHACQFLGLACLYGLDDLRDECIQLAVEMDQADFLRSEKEFPLPADILRDILEKKVDALTLKTNTIEKARSETEKRCHDLEDVAKALWSNDGGSIRMNTNKIEVIRLALQYSKPFKCIASSKINVANIEWCMVAHEATYQGGEKYLQITLVLNGQSYWKDWSCKVGAKVRILRHDESKKHLWKSEFANMTSTNNKLTLSNILEMSVLWSAANKFFVNKKVNVDMFLLIEDVYVAL